MAKRLNLQVSPEVGFDEQALSEYVIQQEGIQEATFKEVHLLKRSIDARAKKVKVNVSVDVFVDEPVVTEEIWGKSHLQNIENAESVIIVGAGPAGLFAALELIEQGKRPIVLERGKDVKERRRDLANINKKHIVNSESNYCFGEGGAGTYSDGKLYTRSKKRGDIRRVLEMLVAHGATSKILVDAHPHIGTNKLPKLIQDMRETIISCGGEVRFGAKVTNFLVTNSEIKGVEVNYQEKEYANAVILATGHSARDIFTLLKQQNILIEAKPFALGVRIEHSQKLIDSIQYHCDTRGEFLPPASYSLVTQVPFKGGKQGMFSFCMCPGGFIVPSATETGEVVVNGMSPSKRDSKYSNSGIVVTVNEEDFAPFKKEEELAGLAFQRSIEQKACVAAGSTQKAPAQRLVDFVNGKVSTTLPDTSYIPGLTPSNLKDVLPHKVAQVLRKGFKDFGKKMKGYYTNEAQVVGVESRTSSPVKIPRDKETCEHPQIQGLYPCGEGAGYAGGIVSAAMDGIRCAREIVIKYDSQK
ncbi:MAG: FAD-binding protein [Cytophagales bacterium]|nr:FAD-binding protein [Cytophagales bacterium]